jgi:hypothetical protein
VQLNELGQRGVDGLFLGFALAELDCFFDEGMVEIEHRDDGTPPNANTPILRGEFAGGKRWFFAMLPRRRFFPTGRCDTLLGPRFSRFLMAWRG